MVARAARLLLLVQLLLALAIGLGLQHMLGTGSNLPHWLAYGCGFLVVLCVRALIAANNFRLAARHADPDRPPGLGWYGGLALYFRELIATLVSSSWNMPFRPVGGPHLHDRAAPPVLLIHGYGCNSGYWRSMHRRLREARMSHLAIDLEPVLADIDQYVPQVAAAVDALRIATGQSQVIIIGHSMGGLVARAWARACGQEHLACLITLGTPHHGTVLACFAPGRNSRQMCRAAVAITETVVSAAPAWSDWLRALHAAPGQAQLPLVSLYSKHDNIIAPASSAIVAGAVNIGFTGIGHVALGSHPAVLAQVIKIISAHAGDAPAASMAHSQAATSIQEKPSS